jgi:hypothetical protein
MTKHRGALQVVTAADQVFVKVLWDVAKYVPELHAIFVAQKAKLGDNVL